MHSSFYTDPFTHRCLYTENNLQTEASAHSTLLHTASLYTERLCFPFLITYLWCSPHQVSSWNRWRQVQGQKRARLLQLLVPSLRLRLSVCACVCKHRSHTHRWKRVAWCCMHFARDNYHCRNVLFNAEPRGTTACFYWNSGLPNKCMPPNPLVFHNLAFLNKHFGVYPIAFIFFPCLHTYVYIVGYPVMHHHDLQCISWWWVVYPILADKICIDWSY